LISRAASIRNTCCRARPTSAASMSTIRRTPARFGSAATTAHRSSRSNRSTRIRSVPICAFGFGCLLRNELIFNGIHFGNSVQASVSEPQNSTHLARSIGRLPTIFAIRKSAIDPQPWTAPFSPTLVPCFASTFTCSNNSILCPTFSMFSTISGNRLLARSKPRRLYYIGFWNSFGTAGSRTVGVMTPLHLHLGRTKSESAAWIFARSRPRFTFLDRDLLFQNCLRIDSRCLNLHIVFAFVAGIFPKLVTWFLSMSAYHEGGDLPRSRIH
jgi:hypothetical protein